MTCIVFVGHTKILYNQLTWTLHAQKHILDHKSIHTMNMMKGNTIKITSKYGTPVFLEVNLELYCTLVQQKKTEMAMFTMWQLCFIKLNINILHLYK